MNAKLMIFCNDFFPLSYYYLIGVSNLGTHAIDEMKIIKSNQNEEDMK